MLWRVALKEGDSPGRKLRAHDNSSCLFHLKATFSQFVSTSLYSPRTRLLLNHGHITLLLSALWQYGKKLVLESTSTFRVYRRPWRWSRKCQTLVSVSWSNALHFISHSLQRLDIQYLEVVCRMAYSALTLGAAPLGHMALTAMLYLQHVAHLPSHCYV